MTTAVINETDRPDLRTQTVDAARRVAHLSHEARLVKTVATDAAEGAVHAAEQAIKTATRRVEDLADRRYEVAHRLRQQPFKAVAIGFGVGVLLSAVTLVVYRAAGRSGTGK